MQQEGQQVEVAAQLEPHAAAAGLHWAEVAAGEAAQ